MLIEAHDEWQVTDRRYLSEATMAQLNPPDPATLPTRTIKEATAAIKTA